MTTVRRPLGAIDPNAGAGASIVAVSKRTSCSPCDPLLPHNVDNSQSSSAHENKKRKTVAAEAMPENAIQTCSNNNNSNSGAGNTNNGGSRGGGQGQQGSGGYAYSSFLGSYGSGGSYGGGGGFGDDDDPNRNNPYASYHGHSHNVTSQIGRRANPSYTKPTTTTMSTTSRVDPVSLTSVLLQARREVDLGMRHYQHTTRRPNEHDMVSNNSSLDTIGSGPSNATPLGSPKRANVASVMQSSGAQAVLTRLNTARASPVRTATPTRTVTATATPAQPTLPDFSTHTSASARLQQYRTLLGGMSSAIGGTPANAYESTTPTKQYTSLQFPPSPVAPQPQLSNRATTPTKPTHSYTSETAGLVGGSFHGSASTPKAAQILLSPRRSPTRGVGNLAATASKVETSKPFPLPWEFQPRVDTTANSKTNNSSSKAYGTNTPRNIVGTRPEANTRKSTPNRVASSYNLHHSPSPSSRKFTTSPHSRSGGLASTYNGSTPASSAFEQVLQSMGSPLAQHRAHTPTRNSPLNNAGKGSQSPVRAGTPVRTTTPTRAGQPRQPSAVARAQNTQSSGNFSRPSNAIPTMTNAVVATNNNISAPNNSNISVVPQQQHSQVPLPSSILSSATQEAREKEERRRHSVGASARPRADKSSSGMNPLIAGAYSALHDKDHSSILQQKSSSGLLCSFINSWAPKYHESVSAYREGGYLTVKIGDVFIGRYEVLHKLGWGEFSTVWLAFDRQSPKDQYPFVAIKISKCAPQVLTSTRYEINLLAYLNQRNRQDSCALVTLLNDFEHVGAFGTHLCMVMPLLGPNLLCIIDQMKAKRRMRSDKEIHMIKDTIRASLQGLAELDDLNMVHTDIKPENILCSSLDAKTVKTIQNCVERRNTGEAPLPASAAVPPNSPSCVRVADFGLSFLLEPSTTTCPLAKRIGTRNLKVETPGVAVNTGVLIQTREYRAPEVLFGHDFSPRSDVWSLGCVVFELITGDFLLDPKRKTKVEREMDIEHVAMIMQLLGPVPTDIATRPGRHIANYFHSDGRFRHSERYRHYKTRSLRRELESFLPGPEAASCASFIHSCLSYSPDTRMSARELLRDPWLMM